MFNPERLLKSMMGGALGGALGGERGRKKKKSRGLVGGALGGLGTGQKAALGLGALGVAMAAWEHYKGQSAAPAQPMRTAPPQPSMMPPPPPPPPPAPAAALMSAAPPAPPASGLVPEALLAIRSMIAAAAADGLIDGNEREAILGRAEAAGLDPDDLAALRSELAQPLSMPELLAQTPPELAAEVYAAALITISIDTEAERRWMQRLAEGLNLDPSERADIDAQFGAPTQP
ncbi:MAG: tellurite resistance TerB family protein [Aquimonas sp.]|nr:tellurite resistance TerB family protein [Aquimonas sp.]